MLTSAIPWHGRPARDQITGGTPVPLQAFAGQQAPTTRVRTLGFAFAFVALSALQSVRAAEMIPKMLLLDGAIVGSDIVAVGERGTILRSSNHARTWRPVRSPTSATLTAISFAADGQHGWAVGHDALVLATTDGGRTWQQQYQGESLQDPFLDVLALDAQRVIVIGAYGRCIVTIDGGTTWTRRKIIEEDSHLNRITRGPAGTLYIAGEHGTLVRSTDAGTTWKPIPAPYTGSFYGVLALDRQRLLVHGLRGHVYRSIDDGATWEPVTTPQPVLLAAALKMKSNYIVLGGQARGLMISRDYARTFDAFPELTTAVSELLELPDGNVLALGESGAAIFSVTAAR